MIAQPGYDELPVLIADGEYRHAWHTYDPADERGTLRNITDGARRDAMHATVSGRVVNLSLPLNEPAPPLFGRQSYQHTIFSTNRNSLDDRLDSFYPQSSSQWDGFRHVRAREFGFFGGFTGDFEGSDHLGVQAFAEQGIIGRGVLLDLEAKYRDHRERGEDGGCYFDAADLQEAVERAGVDIAQGDILCIRTGWMHRYQHADANERLTMGSSRTWPGLAGSPDVAKLLWEWQVSAVAADNPAVEGAPGRLEDGSLHRRAVPLLGLVFAELLTFEELAVALAQAGGSPTFAFVSVPLNLPGGVGSPANAVALL